MPTSIFRLEKLHSKFHKQSMASRYGYAQSLWPESLAVWFCLELIFFLGTLCLLGWCRLLGQIRWRRQTKLVAKSDVLNLLFSIRSTKFHCFTREVPAHSFSATPTLQRKTICSPIVILIFKAQFNRLPAPCSMFEFIERLLQAFAGIFCAELCRLVIEVFCGGFETRSLMIIH